LEDHQDALKVKEDKLADFCWGEEELSAVGKAATEEISQLKEDLCHEVRACLSQEELMRLRGNWRDSGKSWKKGFKVLKDSELHQRESALLATQLAL